MTAHRIVVRGTGCGKPMMEHGFTLRDILATYKLESSARLVTRCLIEIKISCKRRLVKIPRYSGPDEANVWLHS